MTRRTAAIDVPVIAIDRVDDRSGGRRDGHATGSGHARGVEQAVLEVFKLAVSEDAAHRVVGCRRIRDRPVHRRRLSRKTGAHRCANQQASITKSLSHQVSSLLEVDALIDIDPRTPLQPGWFSLAQRSRV